MFFVILEVDGMRFVILKVDMSPNI